MPTIECEGPSDDRVFGPPSYISNTATQGGYLAVRATAA